MNLFLDSSRSRVFCIRNMGKIVRHGTKVCVRFSLQQGKNTIKNYLKFKNITLILDLSMDFFLCVCFKCGLVMPGKSRESRACLITQKVEIRI